MYKKIKTVGFLQMVIVYHVLLLVLDSFLMPYTPVKTSHCQCLLFQKNRKDMCSVCVKMCI